MVGKTESVTEKEIGKILEDSDTEYIEKEPIPDNKEESSTFNTRSNGLKSWIQMSHQFRKLKRKSMN